MPKNILTGDLADTLDGVAYCPGSINLKPFRSLKPEAFLEDFQINVLAAEWAPAIRVNCIAPSLTDTPLAARLLSSDEKKESAGARRPLKRVGTAAEVASLAYFLLSEKQQLDDRAGHWFGRGASLKV